MKKKILVLCLITVMSAGLCSCSLKQAVNNVTDIINGEKSMEEKEIDKVKNGYLQQYGTDITTGKALGDFLKEPEWSYFETSGQKIVQCSGKCNYNNENVEAKVQFQLNGDSFDIRALALNDVSQSASVTDNFFRKVYEGHTGTATPVPAVSNAAVPESSTYSSVPSSGGSASVTLTTDTYDLNRIYLSPSSLSSISKDEVRALLNAMYAYHGYSFNKAEYTQYFLTKSWYRPAGRPMDVCEAEFNPCEKSNKETIVNYEKSRGWR